VNKLAQWLRYGSVLVVVALGAIFLAGFETTASAATPPQLNLRILLVGGGAGDPTTDAWQATLTSEGVPYTLATATGSYGSETVTLPALSSGTVGVNGVGNFNGVVIADSPYAFAGGALNSLFAYESAYGVRQLDGYIYPSSSLGLVPAGGGVLDGTTGTLTTAALAAMPQLKGPVPFDTGIYGYPATTVAGAPVTPWLTNSAGQVLAAVYQHPGTDAQANVAELALTFNYNASSLQWLLLGPGLIDWVTQNTHLGLYRNYFGQDVDDVFIADNEWSRQYQCTPAATNPVDVGCPVSAQGNAAAGPPDSLMSAADVAYVTNWEQQTGIKLEFAFNAVGACTEPATASTAKCSGSTTLNGTTYTDPGSVVDTTAADSTGLVSALLANQASFNWITHTWSHLYLGCLTWQPPGTNAATVGGGGSLAAGNYSYQVTAATAYGESEPSSPIAATVGANGSVSLSWPDATNGGGPTLATLESQFTGGTGFWGYKVYRQNPGTSIYGLVGQVAENPAGGTGTYGFTDTGAGAPGVTPDTTSSYPTATNPGIDCAGSAGSGWVPASATDPATSIEGQIGLDVAFAQANGLTNYTPNAIVTGEHSGLESPNMPAALAGVGITTFGSDASRQPNPYTITSGSNVANAAPRYPSNIYYNASNWQSQLSEYNTLYVAPGVSIGDTTYPGETGRCSSSSVTTCQSTAATEASVLASESHIMLGHVLANNPRMGYAHQSNLVGPAQLNGSDYGYTLLSLINNMLAQYNSWYTAPLTQITDVSASVALKQQSAWAATQSAGSVSASIRNGVVTVTNSGAGAVTGPVTVPTGTTVNGGAFGQPYGGTLSDWTTLGGGTSQTLTENVSPTITSGATAQSIVGSAFSFTVATTGAPTPAITETGALPVGLTFTDNGNGNGTIAGTATHGTGGSYPLTVTATSTAGTATQSVTLTNAEAPAITSPSTAGFTVGSAGTYTVTTTGYPAATITESGALPAGLSFVDKATGTATVAGTPAAGTAGTYPVTISATNSSGSTATLGLTVTVVNSAAPVITSGGAAYFTAGQNGAFAITATGSPTPVITETGVLPAGVTFTDQGTGTALLQGTPAASGTTNLTVTATNASGGTSQSLSVIVGKAPAITSPATASFGTGTAGSFTITTTGYPAPAIGESGALPAGLSFVDKTDGTATIAGTPAAGTAGTFPVTVTATNGTGSTQQTLAITVVNSVGPAITSSSPAYFTAGQNGSFAITATGSPTPAITEAGVLPPGLTFTDQGNGTALLQGTPAASGTTNLTVTATNASGGTSQSLSVVVGTAPAITSPTGTSFSTGTAGSFTVTTTGYPAPTIGESGILPAGLSFVDNKNGTATLAGTPTAGGTYVLTVTATNHTGSTQRTLTITVNQAPKITSASTLTATVGKTFSFTVTATGYPQPTLGKTGTFPSGVLFTANTNGTATIHGTPLTSGTYPVTITATSTAGTTTQLFSLVVDQAPTITSAGTAKFSTGTASSFTVTTTGNPASTIGESGALPAGVSFVDNKNGTATIAGTPAAAAGGRYVLTITATNLAGSTRQTLTITVNQAPKITSASTLNANYFRTFSFTVTTTGYPQPTLSRTGNLPWGVQFTANNNGTATISGTPLVRGTYRLAITATSAAGTTTQAFTMTVK
jgi:Putative Ig domain